MICCRARTLVARQAGKALSADSTAALSSASVICGTRVTRLLVAGSCRSMNCVELDETNLLSMKAGVSSTFWILSCVVGYAVAAVARPALGRRCRAVACILLAAVAGLLPELILEAAVTGARVWRPTLAAMLRDIRRRMRCVCVWSFSGVRGSGGRTENGGG